MATPLTGDIKNRTGVKKEGVTLHNMPVVTEAALLKKGHVINQSAVSGKRLGSVVTIVKSAKPVLYQAAGSETDSLWIAVTNGASDLTPID